MSSQIFTKEHLKESPLPLKTSFPYDGSHVLRILRKNMMCVEKKSTMNGLQSVPKMMPSKVFLHPIAMCKCYEPRKYWLQ